MVYEGQILEECDSCMMELECSSINMNVELRPRSGGFKIGISVQDLYLHDKMTTGSLCTTLIEPVKKVVTVCPSVHIHWCIILLSCCQKPCCRALCEHWELWNRHDPFPSWMT